MGWPIVFAFLTARRAPMPAPSMKTRHYPETMAGGYTRVDGTMAFYARIHSLLQPDMRILEFGAGRGAAHDSDLVHFRRSLRLLSGEGRRVIGVDVDPVVVTNPFLDEAHVVAPDTPLPFADSSFDMIVSDYVFEHLTNASFVAAELGRVLAPGGWICARTPNRWSLIGLAVQLTPNRLHYSVLSRFQAEREVRDVFPTAYQLNSRAALELHFPPRHWRHATYSWDAEPGYAGESNLLWWFYRMIFRVSPRAIRTNLFIFLQKR